MEGFLWWLVVHRCSAHARSVYAGFEDEAEHGCSPGRVAQVEGRCCLASCADIGEALERGRRSDSVQRHRTAVELTQRRTVRAAVLALRHESLFVVFSSMLHER